MRNLLRRVSNIIAWLPILWADRDWDFAFLLRIMRFKISRMRRHHQKYGLSTYKRQALIERKMRTCELLITRILEEDYLKSWTQPSWSDWPRAFTEQEVAEMKKASEHDRRMQRQDEDLLFSILRKHYRNWWD